MEVEKLQQWVCLNYLNAIAVDTILAASRTLRLKSTKNEGLQSRKR